MIPDSYTAIFCLNTLRKRYPALKYQYPAVLQCVLCHDHMIHAILHFLRGHNGDVNIILGDGK